MKAIHSIATLLFLSLVSSACGKGSSSSDSEQAHHQGHGGQAMAPSEISKHGLFRAELDWQSPPVAGQPVNQVEIRFSDPDGEPLEANLIGFHPWMPGHGHGTNESAQTFEPATSASDRFLVSGIYFNMGGGVGEWVIRLVVTIDGQSDEIVRPVDYEVR